MAETHIKPNDLMNLSLSEYQLNLKKDLNKLGATKQELHDFLYIKDFYFKTKKSNLLLFIDVKKDWQEVPVIKAISEGDVVVEGQELFENKIERNRAEKYIFNSIFGECMVTKVADFDEDGNPDYAIAIHKAFGERGATKDKMVKILEENKESLFGRKDIHVMLSKELRKILDESRAVEAAKKERHKESLNKFPNTTEQADTVETSGDEEPSDG